LSDCDSVARRAPMKRRLFRISGRAQDGSAAGAA
jgi:hypothetical protein